MDGDFIHMLPINTCVLVNDNIFSKVIVKMSEISSIHNIVESAFFGAGVKSKGKKVAKPPVVTVARDFGAGGAEVACLLAKSLKVECFDDQIMDYVAGRIDVNKTWQKRLDEKVPRGVDDWVVSLFSKNMTLANHQKYLIQSIRAVAGIGGVIIGRGSNLILADANVFHLKIIGSKELRAERISKREEMTVKEAKEKAISVDKERVAFVRALYKHCPKELDRCDLTINSDNKTAEQIVKVVVYAMRKFGYLSAS